MKHGEELLRWAREQYMAWWDTRHDVQREPADELLARVYLQGAIDALADEAARHRQAIAVRQQPEQGKAAK